MSGSDRLENVNPQIHGTAGQRAVTPAELDDSLTDPIDAREVFDLIRDIADPEHPLTLEQLNVVEQQLIEVDPAAALVQVRFTPTIPHCSMATLIGLSIKVKLERSLPARFKIDVRITPGSHASERAVNKQLADKERVAAATENGRLLEVVSTSVWCRCRPRQARDATLED